MRTVCPTRTRSPIAIAPDSRSAPMIGRTRKSPRSYSGWFSSITSPIRTPAAASSRSCSGRAAITSPSRSIAGLPASSPITFASALVIVISGPTGPAPWETQGSTCTPRRRTRDRAVGVDLAVAEQDGAAGEGGARQPAEHGHLRPRALERGQQLLGGEAEWVAERDQRLVAAGLVGACRLERLRAVRAGESPRASRSAVEVHASRSRRPGSEAAQTTTPGLSSSSRPPATMPPAPQPIRCPGLEALVHLGEQPLRHARGAGPRRRRGEVAGRPRGRPGRGPRPRRRPRPCRSSPTRRPRSAPSTVSGERHASPEASAWRSSRPRSSGTRERTRRGRRRARAGRRRPRSRCGGP